MGIFLDRYYIQETQGKKLPAWRDEVIWEKAKRGAIHAFRNKVPSLKKKITKDLKAKGKKKIKELGKKKVLEYLKLLDKLAKKGKLPGYPQLNSVYQFVMSFYKKWGGPLKNK